MTSTISAQTILEAAKEAKTVAVSPEKLEASRELLAWLKDTRALYEKAAETGEELYAQTCLEGRSNAFKSLLFETLGSGEIRILIDGGTVRMEETAIPALWRMLVRDKDLLVASCVPAVVLEACRKGEAAIVEPEEKPAGLFASPAILSELRAALSACDLEKIDPNAVPMAVELSRQPLSPADRTYLNAVLGKGSVEVQMKGFAKSRIEQTRIRGLWRSRILNNAGKELMDAVLVAALPSEIPTTPEDFPLAIAKLTAEIEWLERDIARSTPA